MNLIDLEIIDIKPWCIKLDIAAQKSEKLQNIIDEKGRINLADPVSLSIYNQAVAKVMADLDITVPESNLIPTICLRQAYLVILMESLLTPGNRILEIGTGASSIIALLASKLYGLLVDATEIDMISFESAKRNISANNLETTIRLLKSNGELLEGLIEKSQTYHALICYPPTYPDEDKKDHLAGVENTGFRGTVSEMIGGGSDGFEFISKLISEAVSFDIKHITLLLIFEEHADRALKMLKQYKRKTRIIVLKAGMRRRYLVIGTKTEFDNIF